MRIGEIAEITGLSISNIRFYEKKGLIEPARGVENQYREYTEFDLQRLQQIVLYRKMNMSIEHIAMILDGIISLEEAIGQQLTRLEQEKEMLEGSIALCRKVLEIPELSASEMEYCLNYVEEEEAKGTRFAELNEVLEDFADFVQIKRFLGDPYVGRFLVNRTVYRLLAGVVAFWMAVLPIIIVWDSYKDHGFVQGKAIAFCFVWIIGLCIPFIHFRRKSKSHR